MATYVLTHEGWIDPQAPSDDNHVSECEIEDYIATLEAALSEKAAELAESQREVEKLTEHIRLTLRGGASDSNMFNDALFHAEAMRDEPARKLYGMLKREAQQVVDAARDSLPPAPEVEDD